MLENISNEMIQKVFFLQISQNIFIHQWYFLYSMNEKKKGVVFPFDKSSNQFEQSVSQSSSNKGRKIDQINISMIPRILNPQLSRVLYSPPSDSAFPHVRNFANYLRNLPPWNKPALCLTIFFIHKLEGTRS